jgi:hypothetical protein
MFKVICDHTPALRIVGALIGAPLVRSARQEDAVAAPPVADTAPAFAE